MATGRPASPALRKHLMTPGHPRAPQRRSMSLTSVQRWVLSTLAATTILHLAAGIVVAACFAVRIDAQVGLLVISAAFGVLAFEAALLIHHHRPVSWWLLPGLLPAVVGAWLVLG
ncbi:MAG TPA: hypothetical protein VFX52_14435 [Nocardioidaceae bacterium]|nr:hypothetical protein [Nocardioidaceae bacterium]